MNDADRRLLDRLRLKEEIEAFLYHEAELLDERRYEEWLALFTDDVHYWMPMRRNVPADELAREFTRDGRDVNWFDEGKDTLTRRVKQIGTGVHSGGAAALADLPHGLERPGRAAASGARRGGGSLGQEPVPALPQPR